MFSLRLIVPPDTVDEVVEHLLAAPGVAHVVRVPNVASKPPGELVLCDVAREAANDLIEWLQEVDVHHAGAITAVSLETVISDAAAKAELSAPGSGADAVVWEELEARARSEAALSGTFLIFIGVAAVIGVVALLSDSPLLMAGAMVLGPEYGALAALCIATVRRRWHQARRAGGTLAAGFGVAALAALVSTVAFRAVGLAPDEYVLTDRQLTAFVADPDGMAAVVAILAGIVGMLSLTSATAAPLIGVLVSATTIPAIANIGLATAYGQWAEVRGAALQLAVNITGLVGAGIATLTVQSRMTTHTSLRRAS